MAPIKRKGASVEEGAARNSTKRPRVVGNEQASDNGKRNQKGREESPPSSNKKAKNSSLSVIRDEEPSFPRGGGSVLTPLEKKQIQNQATRDVLFEEKRSGRTEAHLDDDDQDEDINMKDLAGKSSVSKKSRKPRAKKGREGETTHKTSVRVEGLSFKRLVEGSMVLGQVTSVSAHDITLSLPNNLVGFVPLTGISKGLDKKIEKLLDDDKESEEGAENDNIGEEALDLKAYFRKGQYLRAYVTSVGDFSSESTLKKSKKRIELSIDPRLTNSGVQQSDLVENVLVQAAVSSIEDHGLVMDLGIGGTNPNSFMSSKDVDPEIDYSTILEGSVFLCAITSFNTSRTVFKLSSNLKAFGSNKKSHYLSSAPTINSFLPGTAAEILLTEVLPHGMVGKIMGVLDATVDLVHSGANCGVIDLTKNFQSGAKVKGRIICTFPASEPFKVGFSILDHVLKLTSLEHRASTSNPLPAMAAIIPETKVVKVDPGLGLYAEIGDTKALGFVHISRLSDGNVETICPETGSFRVGSTHQTRIIGYNALDDLYLLSSEKSVIDQPFLRLEDVAVGAVVKGKIEKLLTTPAGVDGLIVILADGISGLVPSMHFADALLQYPERKFREGLTVSARVLSVNLEKRQIRLTLKKSLLNSDSPVWKDYAAIRPGSQSPGTIVSLQSHGAVVQFYGLVRGFLPVSEMSEAYITDPSQHFKRGQVVNVHALSVDASNGKLAVSCKDPASFSDNYRIAFDKISPGAEVTGTVFEKSGEDLLLKLEDTGVIARLDLPHVVDGTISKQQITFTKIRVGQKLTGLLVLDINRTHRLIKVTGKSSLNKANREKAMPGRLDDLEGGHQVTGFVRNITPHGVFVEFLKGLTALIPKRLIPDADIEKVDFGLLRHQTVSATIHQIEKDAHRLTLSLKARGVAAFDSEIRPKTQKPVVDLATNPVDDTIQTLSDYTFGRVTKAQIASVKDTQINVVLADNAKGRVDFSEVFDDWQDIKDRKKPLNSFRPRQILNVRVLGIHDARTHKFLPISHRSGTTPIFELSAKPSFIKAENPSPLRMDQITIGSEWVGFINNVTDGCIWVNLSPNVRGKLRPIDLSNDLAQLADVEKNYPIGSALKVHVTAIDLERGVVHLSAKEGVAGEVSLEKLSAGMILPGRITKITERQLIVQLSDTLVGAVNLLDLADDYSKADLSTYRKNEIVRACVIHIDKASKRISLSLRPSKVLSSALPVQDPEIIYVKQLKLNEVVRGFVKKIVSNGLFVSLGHEVTAYVRISDLSDSYLKDWQDFFQVDQLVKGKVIHLDPENIRVQMSLKDSALDPNYKAPLTLRDYKAGQIVTGKVRNVEEFGAFIVIDGSANVSGLCHRSEMAEQRVDDARKLFEKHDTVKAKILKIDLEKERISFGLKASYFTDGEIGEEDEDAEIDSDGESEDDMSNEIGGVELDDNLSGDDVTLTMTKLAAGTVTSNRPGKGVLVERAENVDEEGGLDAGPFDWTGSTKIADEEDEKVPDDDNTGNLKRKKRNRKPEIQIDRTGDLDANGPQSVADYERLLLGEPDSSVLWLKYMAFELELGEVEKAREIGERAIRSINIGEELEKLNVWVALLNLENTYGNDETLDATFQKACQYNDAHEIYERMISIFIQSAKNDKADELFQKALKKKISPTPKFFLNYATFLFDTMAAPDRGRALLSRALQSLPSHTHVEVTSRFGQLEFRSANGDVERGRTVFEGLLSSFPKRIDLWNVLIDLEMKSGDSDQVRRLFERVLGISSTDSSGKKGKLTHTTGDGKKKLKSKQAKFFFKKWLAFEETLGATKGGNERMVEEVKNRAVEYVKTLAED